MRCSRLDCIAPATASPVLLVRVTKDGPAARAVIPIVACELHQGDAELDDFVDDEQWQKLADTFVANGYDRPRREFLSFEWTPIKDPVPRG